MRKATRLRGTNPNDKPYRFIKCLPNKRHKNPKYVYTFGFTEDEMIEYFNKNYPNAIFISMEEVNRKRR